MARGAANLSVTVPRHGQPASLPSPFYLVLVALVTGLLVLLPVPVLGGFIVVWERKISGRMQSRPGPTASVPAAGCSGWPTA